MERKGEEKVDSAEAVGQVDGGDRTKEIQGGGKGAKEEATAVELNLSHNETRVSRLQTQHPVAPIQVAPRGAATSATAAAGFQPTPTPPQVMLSNCN